MLSYQLREFGKPLAQVLRETPPPQGSEVLLRVAACGVCHSDVHLHDGYFDLGAGNKLDMARTVQPPRTLGHEIAGSVVALGPEATGVSIGERRVAYPWIGCGDCATCHAGDEHLCNAARVLGIYRDGGFADHVLVPDAKYLLAYDPLPDAQACTYACAGLTAYSALKKIGRLAAGDQVLIIGAGGVGLSAIRLAQQLCGVAPIVAEVDRGRWDIARAAGAAELLDPSDEGAAKALVKASAGGLAAVVDFVGAAASFAFGLGVLRKGGHLVCVGLHGGATPLLPVMLALKAVRITGSYVGSLQEMREVLAVARAGGLPDLPLSERPLAQADAALAELKAGQIRGRAILRP